MKSGCYSNEINTFLSKIRIYNAEYVCKFKRAREVESLANGGTTIWGYKIASGSEGSSRLAGVSSRVLKWAIWSYANVRSKYSHPRKGMTPDQR
jgi:hypothetical protein